MIPIGAALALVMSSVVAEAGGPDIAGDWLRSDGTARIRIASCGSQMCAINTWIKDERSGESVGDQFVMTLEPQDGSRLVGAAFDVKRNMNYSLRISFEDRDSRKTHGCIIDGIICRTMRWTRTR